MAKAREVRHVKGERGPISDHPGQGGNEDRHKLLPTVKLARLRQEITKAVGLPNGPGEQERGHDENERSCPILYFSEQVHAAIYDVDIKAPEE